MTNPNTRFGEVARFPLPSYISIGVTLIAFIFILLTSLAYYTPTIDKDFLDFFVNVVSASAVVVSAFYIGDGIREDIRSRQNQEARQNQNQVDADALRREDKALDLISRWSSPHLCEARKTTRIIRDLIRDKSISEYPSIIKAKLDNDDPDHKIEQDLTTIMNFLEEMAVATLKDVANEELLRNYYEFIVHRFCSLFQLWITEQQQEREITLYANVLKLKDRWTPRSNHS